MQLDTLFRVFSLSKIVRAVAVMMLYEQGSFLLDDPVADYLPEFANIKVYTDDGLVAPKRPMNIRHPLIHTSGISTSYDDHPVGKLYKKHGIDHQWSTVTSGITLQEYIKQQATLPRRSHPGAGAGFTAALLGYANLSTGSYSWGAADTRFVIDPANAMFFLTFNLSSSVESTAQVTSRNGVSDGSVGLLGFN